MVGGYQHLPWKKLIANLRQHDYAMMDASSSSSFSSSPSISSSPHPSPFGDMTHVTWRSIHVEPIGSTDSFELLTKFQSDAEKGYHLLVTDLVHVWEAVSGVKSIREQSSAVENESMVLANMSETLEHVRKTLHEGTHKGKLDPDFWSLRSSHDYGFVVFNWTFNLARKDNADRAEAAFLRISLIQPLMEMVRILKASDMPTTSLHHVEPLYREAIDNIDGRAAAARRAQEAGKIVRKSASASVDISLFDSVNDEPGDIEGNQLLSYIHVPAGGRSADARPVVRDSSTSVENIEALEEEKVENGEALDEEKVTAELNEQKRLRFNPPPPKKRKLRM